MAGALDRARPWRAKWVRPVDRPAPPEARSITQPRTARGRRLGSLRVGSIDHGSSTLAETLAQLAKDATEPGVRKAGRALAKRASAARSAQAAQQKVATEVVLAAPALTPQEIDIATRRRGHANTTSAPDDPRRLDATIELSDV